MREKLLIAYYAFKDKRTPWYVKVVLFLLIAYIISPIDIIPDFIPVLGLLDEIILVPIVFAIIYPLIPEEVKQDYKESELTDSKHFVFVGIFIVVSVWLLLIYLAASYLLHAF